MADFIAYQKREERVQRDDGKVALAPDRWQSLVDFIRVNYGDHRPGKEITVHEPTDVLGVLYLPAVYLAA